MNRRQFLWTTAAAAPPVLAQRGGRRKPNVIVIVGDDLGYGDVPSTASDIPTPHLDSIAKNGVRFTNGYVTCPVCSPTRAGLMTGRYQQRFGHEFNPGPAALAEENFGLPLTETTLADRMKALRYRTAAVGKWHLGYRPEFHPLKRGFDEFFGFLGGAHSYLNARADSANPIMRGTEAIDEKEHLTDALTREAVSFIDRQRSAPFFLYLAYNAVHAPMEGHEKHAAKADSIADPKRRTVASMLMGLDDGVGQVLAKVRAAGLEEDTLVIFITDNGGPTAINASKNDPLRGVKGQVLEGGIRVPFLMQWKGSKLPKGVVYEHPVIALDILPTAVTAAGGKPAANLDGVDLVGAVLSRKRAHDKLYWRFGPQSAIRKGDWKLVIQRDVEPKLFNLATDVGENTDLAASHSEKVKELASDYAAWNAQLEQPRWRERQANRVRPGRRI